MVRAQISVWLVDVDDEAAAARSRRYLSPAEQARLGARAQPHRRRALCAHAALRILVAAASPKTAPVPELRADDNGKPFLYGRTGLPHRLRVSLSHAGRQAAVALCADHPIGVDIETTEPIPDRERFARTILSGIERREWDGVAQDRRDTLVMQAFTRKEAVLKALGTGLAGDLRRVATDLLPRPSEPARLRQLPAGAGPPASWTVLDLAARPGLCGAIAVRAPGATVREYRTTMAELLRTFDSEETPSCSTSSPTTPRTTP